MKQQNILNNKENQNPTLISNNEEIVDKNHTTLSFVLGCNTVNIATL